MTANKMNGIANTEATKHGITAEAAKTAVESIAQLMCDFKTPEQIAATFKRGGPAAYTNKKHVRQVIVKLTG